MLTPASFVGWIPNVAGRLSFSHIGQTKYSGRVENYNEADDQGRLVVSVQCRVLRDAMLPTWYLRWLYDLDTRWIFVYTAVSQATKDNSIGLLRGHVHVFRYSRWECQPDDAVTARELVDSFLRGPKNSGNPNVDLPEMRVRMGKLDNSLAELAAYTVACDVKRDGTVDLQLIPTDEELTFSQSFEVLPTELDTDSSRYLANQAYFFLKDIAHTHRHHHRKADTITVVHKNDGQNSWRRETQYRMHSRVVALRLSHSPLAIYDAIGIMAYMKSFSVLAEPPRGFLGRTRKSGVRYNFDQIEMSIRSRLEAQRWRRTQLNLVVTAIPALLIAICNLLKPSTPAVEVRALPSFEPSPPSPTLFDGIRWILSHLFGNDFSGWALAGMMSVFVLLSYGVIDLRQTLFVHRVKRVLAASSASAQQKIWYLISGFFTMAMCGVGIARLENLLSASQVWITCLGLLAFAGTLFAFLPLLLTIPDLWSRLRSRPVSTSITRIRS